MKFLQLTIGVSNDFYSFGCCLRCPRIPWARMVLHHHFKGSVPGEGPGEGLGAAVRAEVGAELAGLEGLCAFTLHVPGVSTEKPLQPVQIGGMPIV